jgi:hypothetical protein
MIVSHSHIKGRVIVDDFVGLFNARFFMKSASFERFLSKRKIANINIFFVQCLG